jgi:hypothetical protein
VGCASRSSKTLAAHPWFRQVTSSVSTTLWTVLISGGVGSGLPSRSTVAPSAPQVSTAVATQFVTQRDPGTLGLGPSRRAGSTLPGRACVGKVERHTCRTTLPTQARSGGVRCVTGTTTVAGAGHSQSVRVQVLEALAAEGMIRVLRDGGPESPEADLAVPSRPPRQDALAVRGFSRRSTRKSECGRADHRDS